MAAALNARRACSDLCIVGAETPSPWLYPARAPIHPKRPYGFDPSGCPPGRVFHFRAPRSVKKNPGDYGLRGKVVMPAGQAQKFSTKYSRHTFLIRCVSPRVLFLSLRAGS